MFASIFSLLIMLNAQAAGNMPQEDIVNIEVWLNKDEPDYYPGERLKVFFKSDRDCYAAIYNIDVGGRENLLFPQPGDNGFIKANRVYELPEQNADYDYEITGPAGVERIIALASTKGLPDLADTEKITRREIEITVEELEPAKLRIISTPPRCRIYIKDIISGERIYIGKTPRTIVLRPGDYVVEIKRFGYQTMKRRIRLEPEERRKIYVRLLP